MSLNNERLIRRIGEDLFIVEGEWSGQVHIGFGSGNHPEVLFPKADLLAAKTFAEEEAQDFPDDGLSILWEKAREALQMDPVSGHSFVKSCLAAGYDIERDGSTVACWVVDQMQTAARAHAADHSSPPSRSFPSR